MNLYDKIRKINYPPLDLKIPQIGDPSLLTFHSVHGSGWTWSGY